MKDDRGPPEGLQVLSDQLGPTTKSHPPNADRERTETSGDIEIKDAVNPDLRDEDINNTSKDSQQEASSWMSRLNPSRLIGLGSSPATPSEDRGSKTPTTFSEDKERKRPKKDLKAEKTEVNPLTLEERRLMRQVNDLEKVVSRLNRDKAKLTDETKEWSRNYADLSETHRKTNIELHKANAELHKANTELHKAKNAYVSLRDDYIKLRRSKEDLEIDLSDERKLVEELKQNIRDQEQVVTKAHSTAISLLARDVSTDLPDDEIKRQLHVIFQEGVYGWCVDNRVSKLADPEKIRSLLESKGIMRSSKLPEYLQFDVADPKIGPATSLQAALGHELCQAFLKDPFFLGPAQMNAALEGLKPEATVAWRIQTCDFLERTTHSLKERDLCAIQARNFAETYEALMVPLDKTSSEELIDLFVAFGKLALKLWKRKTNIKVESLGDPTLGGFKVMYGEMEAHSSVGLLAGDHSLDGRPICVVVRPRIVSQPIAEGGGRAKGIVWSTASVWVSKKDPSRSEEPAGDVQRLENEHWR